MNGFPDSRVGTGRVTPHHAHPRPPSSTHQSHLSLGTWLENGRRGAVGWTALLKRLGDAESIIPGVEGGTQAPRVPAHRRNGVTSIGGILQWDPFPSPKYNLSFPAAWNTQMVSQL